MITVTMTTCKRYKLFEKTINSFLNCCKDIEKIDRWICVDDNSSEEDRQRMRDRYPFFTFYFKTISEKGHPQSMNLIRRLVTTPYLFHLEDDWTFFSPRSYITECLDVLTQSDVYGQCLINKNYTETAKDYNVLGGIPFKTPGGISYFLHEYCETPQDWEQFYRKYGQGLSSAYWKHFSLRPSLMHKAVLDTLGEFNEKISHFEAEYCTRYMSAGLRSVFLDDIYSLHTGRLTSEINDTTKLNAYILNGEKQFSGKEETIREQENTALREPALREPALREDLKEVKTYVVNLNRRQDRWHQFVKQQEPLFLNYSRFTAVDGGLLLPNKQLQRIFENNDYNMREGMVGCAMSHLKLWIELINSPYEVFCILEDDVQFVPEFKEKFLCLYKSLPKDWDIVYLGYHIWTRHKSPDYYDKKKFPSVEKWGTLKSLTYSRGGTGGYLISKKGALGMLRFINRTGMTNGIDTVQQKAADELDIYYPKPHLIYSECYDDNTNVDTDIQRNFRSLDLLLPVPLHEYPERLLKNGVFSIEDALQFRKAIYYVACGETENLGDIVKELSGQTEPFPFDTTEGASLEAFADVLEKILTYSEEELLRFTEEFCFSNPYNITFPLDTKGSEMVLEYLRRFQRLRNTVKSKAEVRIVHMTRWHPTNQETFTRVLEMSDRIAIFTVNGLGSKSSDNRKIKTSSVVYPEQFRNDKWYYEKICYDSKTFQKELRKVVSDYFATN